jgi:large subunit ribosomal protein L13
MKLTSDSIISIDATGKSLGRLASEIALKLQGKHLPGFRRNAILGPKIRVINLKRVRFTGKKFSKKIFYRHTGYIGHLRKEKLSALWEKKPQEVLRHAVKGMLPKNKLRPRMLKRLLIEL